VRGHYFAPIQSVAGALQGGATVSVFAQGSTLGGTQLGTLITQPVYADATSGNALGNPFITVSGNVNFYLAWPQRVDLGIQVPGQAQVFFPDVDVDTNNALVPTVVAGVAAYAISLSDQLILASATGSNLALNLPAAAAGLQYIVKRTDTSGNTMALVALSGQFIDGQASQALVPLARLRVFCDGTAWWIV
jgi:hypothetical protein